MCSRLAGSNGADLYAVYAVGRERRGEIVRQRRVRRERHGLFEHAHAVNRDVNFPAARLAQEVNLEVVALSFDPGALVRLRGAEADAGQPVNAVDLDAAADAVNGPA
jgi:hypothetical protein